MRLNRITAILATIGAAAAGYFAVSAYQRKGQRSPGAPALSDREQDAADDFSATRSAGAGSMRDPPREWSKRDEISDESFPASDPPPVGSRID